MSEVDRFRSVLASRGRGHAAIAGQIRADTLGAAVVELAQIMTGPNGWKHVVGPRPAPRRKAAR